MELDLTVFDLSVHCFQLNQRFIISIIKKQCLKWPYLSAFASLLQFTSVVIFESGFIIYNVAELYRFNLNNAELKI